ncbi:MAG: hypothetical protein IPG02_15495 [Ignavibacteria bacterium]|nr:hypothetical protein [Ignavibacteria bacterium]
MSAAYGGQILVSNDAYEIHKENFDKEKDISFRDLGERRLKDVIEPIRLYQVLSKDLREDFPPLDDTRCSSEQSPSPAHKFYRTKKR